MRLLCRLGFHKTKDKWHTKYADYVFEYNQCEACGKPLIRFYRG